MEVQASNIPAVLKERKQWVLWAEETRDGKPTKVPYNRGGFRASSTDAGTWDTFESVLVKYEMGGYAGIGYVFSADDPFCGIDLDACYKECVQGWAIEIIKRLDTYTEWSPSGTGVKMICEAKFPLANGKNKKVAAQPLYEDKLPGIEIYDHGRFFTITGAVGKKVQPPQPRQDAIEQLAMEYWPVETTLERARRYTAVIEPAISGQGGSKITSKVAMALVKGFGLNESHAIELIREFNARCQPPWNEKELLRKIQWAQKQGGAVGYLRDANQRDWHSIPVDVPEQQTVGVGSAMDVCVAALDDLDQRGQRTVIAALQARYR